MNQRIEAIGILRLVLVLMVFSCHTGIYPAGGVLAVMYFFVLSGFCAFLGYRDRVDDLNFSYWSFLWKKCTRLFPEHWFCLVLMIILMIITQYSINPLALLTNSLLIHSWFPLAEHYFSFNGVTWYLSDLLFLTLVSPVLIRWVKRMPGKMCLLSVCALFSLYLLLFLFLPQENHFYYTVIFPLTRLIDYFIGMAVCRFYLYFKTRKPHASNSLFYLALASMIVSVLTSLYLPALHQLSPFYLIPISITLFSLCVPENDFLGKYRITHLLFDLSKYTLAFYLIHQVVLKYTDYFFDKIGIHNFLIYAPVTFLASVGLSYMMYNVFELKKQGG